MEVGELYVHHVGLSGLLTECGKGNTDLRKDKAKRKAL